jgi:hypothetical protein
VRDTVRRLLWALLVASLLAIGLAKLNAQDDEYQPIYYPGICHYLEPYGWWWYFYDCANDNTLTMETVTVTESGDFRVTDIRRIYLDGRMTHRLIVQPRGK